MGIIDDVLASAGIQNPSGTIGSFAWILIIGVPLLFLVGMIGYWWSSKKLYNVPVRLRRKRSYGYYKEFNTRGGYITTKSGLKIFRIKMGKAPWKYKDIFNAPDSEYMDADNRVYYEQISPDDFIQLRVVNVPRKIEHFIRDISNDEFVQNYGKELLDYLEQNNQYMFLDKGTTYLFKKDINHIDLIKLYQIDDIYYEPINIEKKALIVAKLTKDVDDPLSQKESFLQKITPYLGILMFAIALVIVFYVIRPGS